MRLVAIGLLALAAGLALPQPAASARCDPAGARALVARFVRAYDAGDLAALDRLVARGPAFRWYSSNAPGTRVGAAAYRRDTLRGYFARRHAVGDRLTLVRLHLFVSGGYAQFNFDARRRADDAFGGRTFSTSGKGAAVCRDGKLGPIAVFSLGGRERR